MTINLTMEDFVLLASDDIFPGSELAFPIYFVVAGQFVLYKPVGAVFGESDLARLEKNRIRTLYMPRDCEGKYAVYLDENVSKIVTNTSLPVKEKSRFLIKNAGQVVKGIFNDPENPQTFTKSQALVRNFVDFLKQGISAFHSMVNLSVHDYYTYTHSIGVMTYSIALASQLGITARQTLEDIGTSGLLHDIGKSKIPIEIINKPGPLNDEEWKVMKMHSTYSFEIVSEYEKLPEVSLIAIKQHHENLAGTGYPDGIRGVEIHFFSKVVSIGDIFSALTTDRPYSKGRNTFEALQIMKSIVDKGHIDKNMFQNFVVMLKG